MTFAELASKHFRFLKDQYGCAPIRTRRDKWAMAWIPSLDYRNQTTGVYVQYDVRDAYLDVTLYPADQAPCSVRDRPQGIPLEVFLSMKAPDAVMGSMYNHLQDSKFGKPKMSFDRYVRTIAENLKLHCHDILRGDFSILPDVEEWLRRRQAEITAEMEANPNSRPLDPELKAGLEELRAQRKASQSAPRQKRRRR